MGEATLNAILGERRQLMNLAYRLLGSLSDAEDAVQEAYTRWYALSRAQQEAIAKPGGWLTTVLSRICLDVLGSARARREHYVGEWIPEPLPEPAEWGAAQPLDPADRITLDESISMAYLVMLESMTPAERVAFVLHDVFRYPFAEVADILGRTPAACRQLATSARQRIGAQQIPRAAASRQADVVKAFKLAWEAKDIPALVGILDPAAIAVADGGGVVSAVLRPVEGSEHIARYTVEIANRASGMVMLERTVNGLPGLVAQRDGVTVMVVAFETAGDRITRVWAVRNPEKLRRWTA